MDKALKERSLGSAAARRRKMQERDDELQQKRKDTSREDRDRVVQQLLEYSSDEESDGDDGTSSYTTSEPELDYASSVPTPSDPQSQTPNDIPAPLTIKRKSPIHDLAADAHVLVLDPLEMPSRPWMTKERIRSPPSPIPVLESSLVTLSDWNYERFSTVLDPSKVEEVLAAEETEEPYSPIEVATPIAYSQPRARPSVISIYHIRPKAKSKVPVEVKPTPVAEVKPVPPKSASRAQKASQDIAFFASEATEINVSSNLDLSIVDFTKKTYTAGSQTVPEPASKLQRKPSIPLMTAASRYSHLRLGSKKDSIISVRSSQGPSELLRMSSAPPVTGTIVKDSSPLISSHPEHTRTMSTRGSATIPKRPSTSHGGVSRFSPSLSDMPAVPPPKQSALHSARKKSISMLRSHSESIGQALKSVKAKGRLSMRPDVFPPVPPLPTLVTPRYDQPFLDLLTFPKPPPPPSSPALSSRSSVASYSPFPKTVGLGVRGL